MYSWKFSHGRIWRILDIKTQLLCHSMTWRSWNASFERSFLDNDKHPVALYVMKFHLTWWYIVQSLLCNSLSIKLNVYWWHHGVMSLMFRVTWPPDHNARSSMNVQYIQCSNNLGDWNSERLNKAGGANDDNHLRNYLGGHWGWKWSWGI